MVIEPGNSGVGRGINSSSSSNTSKVKNLDSNTETSSTTAQGENVSLSPEAKILSQLESTLQNLPEVDVERVATIKQEIENGTYTVNADIIAENFIGQDALFE